LFKIFRLFAFTAEHITPFLCIMTALSLTACVARNVNYIPLAAHVRQLAVGLHLKSCDCLRSRLLHKCLIKVLSMALLWVILFKSREREIDFHTIV